MRSCTSFRCVSAFACRIENTLDHRSIRAIVSRRFLERATRGTRRRTTTTRCSQNYVRHPIGGTRFETRRLRSDTRLRLALFFYEDEIQTNARRGSLRRRSVALLLPPKFCCCCCCCCFAQCSFAVWFLKCREKLKLVVSFYFF